MTIDEAIKELEEDIDKQWHTKGPQNTLSHQLGIEALKAWKQFKEGRWMSGRYDLPGETEE